MGNNIVYIVCDVCCDDMLVLNQHVNAYGNWNLIFAVAH